MIYQFLANLFLVVHFAYVLFAIFGGLLVLRWKWIWKLHLPAIIWGFLVQFFVWTCPLTAWENHFRQLAGQTGYSGGFIDYYLTTILYLPVPASIHIVFSIALVGFNIFVYWIVFRSFRKYP